MTNVRSCRKLEAVCRDQIPYLWLTGWQHPDHNTLKLGDFHLFRALRIMRGKMSFGYEYRIGVSPENGIGDLLHIS